MSQLLNKKYMLTLLAILICGFLYYNSLQEQEAANAELSKTNTKNEDFDEDSMIKSDDNIYVYILGEVKKPGVYTFSSKDRMVDVIKKAGGFTKKADKSSVNLAEPITDGAQIEIMKKSKKKAGSSMADSDLGFSGENSSMAKVSDKVNINKASKEELLKLPGIGEAKANLILTYRETNGRFQAIEDIKKISGIKDHVYEQVRDLICV